MIKHMCGAMAASFLHLSTDVASVKETCTGIRINAITKQTITE